MKSTKEQCLCIKWRIQSIVMVLFCLFISGSCGGPKDKEEVSPNVEIQETDFEESTSQGSVEEDTVMEDPVSETLPEIPMPVEENGMLEINTAEDMIPVSEDIMIAQVSLPEILTGNPVLYDRFRIDGWVFE